MDRFKIFRGKSNIIVCEVSQEILKIARMRRSVNLCKNVYKTSF